MSKFEVVTRNLVVLVAIGATFLMLNTSEADKPFADRQGMIQQFKPVGSLSDFMRNTNHTALESLNISFSEKVAKRIDWEKIEREAYVLAEASRLLAERGQVEDTDWVTASLKLYNSGSLLFQAAQKKDHDAARETFKAVKQSCTQCHAQFR